MLEDRRPRALSQRCFRLNDETAAHTAIAAIEKRAPRQAACLRYLLDHPYGCTQRTDRGRLFPGRTHSPSRAVA